MDAECLVIGAGVFGLSVARALKSAGRDVVVVDAVGPGAGASGTPLGVLAPHAPDRWNEKKQAQFEALTTLSSVVSELESETGVDIGYRQCGRLIPLTRETHLPLWQSRARDAETNWRGVASLQIVTPESLWLDESAAPFGAAQCGLTARIDARRYCDALAANLGAIEGGYHLTHLAAGSATFANGSTLRAKWIILATGSNAFSHIPDPEEGTPSGRGEKGQAAVLRLAPGIDVDDFPLIYRDRLYIVPRGEGLVSVGATSERVYEDPEATDEQLEALIERAKAICPRLEGAEIVERWARLRPRAADKRLLVGPHPTLAGVIIATGGFKTGLAMAHFAAQQAAMNVTS